MTTPHTLSSLCKKYKMFVTFLCRPKTFYMYTKWSKNKWDIFVNYIARQAWNIMIKVYYICMIDDYLLYQGKKWAKREWQCKKVLQNHHMTHTNCNCLIKPSQFNIFCISEVQLVYFCSRYCKSAVRFYLRSCKHVVTKIHTEFCIFWHHHIVSKCTNCVMQFKSRSTREGCVIFYCDTCK